MWIDYMCEVCSNIHYLSIYCLACCIAVMLIKSLNDYTSEQKLDIDMQKWLTGLIISAIVLVITPSNLHFDITNKYMKENAQLQKENLEMKMLIERYEINKDLDRLIGD